ncbi:MAG TPA: hypothetical protein VHF25_14540 [Nitriliruptorales bacterium]|nr:hypothetical protein [Nitriliruptorales bacterium]
MPRIHVVLATAALLVGVLATPALAARGGQPGSPVAPDAIWADGDLYGTIAQGALHYNGNERSFDLLVMIAGQAPVAEAAPGNRDYNGGRWLPVSASWAHGGTPTLLTSYAAVRAAVEAGDLLLGTPDTEGAFLCPLIPNR